MRFGLALAVVLAVAGCDDEQCSWTVDRSYDVGDGWSLELDANPVVVDKANSFFVPGSDVMKLRIATDAIASLDLTIPVASSDLVSGQRVPLSGTTLERQQYAAPYEHYWQGSVADGTMLVVEAKHECEGDVCAHTVRAELSFGADTDVGHLELSGPALRLESLQFLCVKCPGVEGCDS
jgi:hypothetical protein